jgi:hypothetical protein
MKHDAENKPVKANAHLIAQGFLQIPSIDFNKTYTPTANPESICLILALANRNNWAIHQVDYKMPT